MGIGVLSRLSGMLTKWLTKDPEHPSESVLLLNFDRLSYELRPGDVILVEGRSKVAEVIKMTTQNPWTHAALYIGRLYEIEDEAVRNTVSRYIDAEPEQQLLVETLLDQGTVVYPLEKYRHEHLRICRPNGLSPKDAQKVITYGINRLGTTYDVRQILDLGRFMFPYSFVPRRWRSSLFNHNAGDPTRTVCSTLVAQAFQSVRFPLLPLAERTDHGKVHIYQRNPRLVTPSDFDYSPYFDIIKYPLFGLDDIEVYRHLPWGDKDIVYNDAGDTFREIPEQVLEDDAHEVETTSNETPQDTHEAETTSNETPQDAHEAETTSTEKPQKEDTVKPLHNVKTAKGETS